MTVLKVHVEDDWTEFPTNETVIYEDSPAGLERAIDYVQRSIPWEEAHMKIYFKGTTNKISESSRMNIRIALKKDSSASDSNCLERFPANFSFNISRKEVL